MTQRPTPNDDRLLQAFRDMVRSLGDPKRHFDFHPPLAVLQAYMSGDLEDRWPPETARDSTRAPEVWGVSDVSLHVQACVKCAHKVAEWRRPACSGWMERFFAFGDTGQFVRAWAWSSAAVALLLIAVSLNWSSQMSSGSTPPARSSQAAPTGAAHIVAGQDGRHEGTRRTQPATTNAAPRSQKVNVSPLLDKNIVL